MLSIISNNETDMHPTNRTYSPVDHPKVVQDLPRPCIKSQHLACKVSNYSKVVNAGWSADISAAHPAERQPVAGRGSLHRPARE